METQTTNQAYLLDLALSALSEGKAGTAIALAKRMGQSALAQAILAQAVAVELNGAKWEVR